jgi:hypothetical protein
VIFSAKMASFCRGFGGIQPELYSFLAEKRKYLGELLYYLGKKINYLGKKINCFSEKAVVSREYGDNVLYSGVKRY